MQRVEIMSANHHIVDMNIEKVNIVTQIVEFLAMIASLFLVTITLPFSLFIQSRLRVRESRYFRNRSFEEWCSPSKSSISFRRLT